MGKHLSVEPEIKGFNRMMKIIDTGVSFEMAERIVVYIERLAAENRADHRYAAGMRSAFTTVCQTLHHNHELDNNAPIHP